MAEFQSRPEHSTGHRRWLWKGDEGRTDWKLDVMDGDSSRRFSDLDDSRLNHYLRIGATHSDIEEEKERGIPIDRKSTVVKWLLSILAFWLIFRFVRV